MKFGVGKDMRPENTRCGLNTQMLSGPRGVCVAALLGEFYNVLGWQKVSGKNLLFRQSDGFLAHWYMCGLECERKKKKRRTVIGQ
jgi:hypothetical protein